MANPEHVAVVKQGRSAIEQWREQHPNQTLDLVQAKLSGDDLSGTNLRDADLTEATLRGANLRAATLTGATLSGAVLIRADLRSVVLSEANLWGVELSGADMSGTVLSLTFFHRTKLSKTVMTGALFQDTSIDATDLSDVIGLENVRHWNPSSIGIDTLQLSRGAIPETFLRGCGLKPWEIENTKLYQPGLSAAEITDIQYKVFDLRTGPILSGSFISYSHADSDFVAVLDKKLQKEGGNVWLDKHQFVAGSVEQNIDRAIRINDIVILVLSKTSLASDWVWDEIESAFEKEKKQNRRVLCPIAVDDSWEKDPPDKRRLMRKIRERVILDFSEWQTPSGAVSTAFDTPFRKLVDGMKINFGNAG